MVRQRIAVIGTGVIGQKHIETILQEPACTLVALADPTDQARVIGDRIGVPVFSDYRQMLEAIKPDGVINSTPNALHVPIALDCIAAGIPSLIEKPVAESIESAMSLAQAVERSNVPTLVGHHRRHNPIIRRAKEIIESGRLGRIVTVTSIWTLLKPEDYFKTDWRRKKGAGPILTNLIHDLDLLRYLVGEIVSVQANTSNELRGFEIEDSAVLSFRFANGALGTATVSDAAVAPWSWELTSKENSFYPTQDENCYFIMGSEASLAIPKLDVWSYPNRQGWEQLLVREQYSVELLDPFVFQLRHFCEVIRGKATPIVSVHDAVQSFRAIHAVQRAAELHQEVAC